jgi:hypothetical protein
MPNSLGYSTAPADPHANPAAGGDKEGTWFVLFGKPRDKALSMIEITISRSGIVLSWNFGAMAAFQLPRIDDKLSC